MTDEQVTLATRQWFAYNAQACIDAAVSGELHVNNLPKYIEYQKQQIIDGMAGEGDHTFAFRQRRHYILTGECVPFLSLP